MRIYLQITLLLISISSNAQKQGNTWYFGKQAGLDFSNGSPIAIFNGRTGTDVPIGSNQEGTAVISDSSGNLLFYTGGRTVWNRDHIQMPNGGDLLGGVSSTQPALIVPKPGSDSLFYIFTSDEFQNYSAPHTPKGYRYSVVDMCKDSGRGDVLLAEKNIRLLDSSTEKLAACEDALGNGYWIIGHKLFGNEFYSWHLTSSGLSSPVISKIGIIHGLYTVAATTWSSGSAQGQMKINPQGTKLALALGNHDPATINIFDFDKNAGVLSNFCHVGIDSLLSKRAYGIEFSPDGTKLYAGVNGGAGQQFIYQFDLNGGDCNTIIASGIRVAQSQNITYMGMQLATNNKIYVTQPGNKVGCIHFPNLIGTAINYDSASVNISPGIYSFSLPTFIAGYKYHNRIPCIAYSNPPVVTDIDSSCALDIKIKIYPNPFGNLLTIGKHSTSCSVTMSLYNVIGQLVIKNKEIKNGITLLALSGLSSGIYYYKFNSSENKVLTGTIIKL